MIQAMRISLTRWLGIANFHIWLGGFDVVGESQCFVWLEAEDLAGWLGSTRHMLAIPVPYLLFLGDELSSMAVSLMPPRRMLLLADRRASPRPLPPFALLPTAGRAAPRCLSRGSCVPVTGRTAPRRHPRARMFLPPDALLVATVPEFARSSRRPCYSPPTSATSCVPAAG
jgi:hypothetical protein